MSRFAAFVTYIKWIGLNHKNRQSCLISSFTVKVRQKRKAHPRLFPGAIPGAVSGLTQGQKQAAN